MIVAMVSEKGGVGKSTLACHLAAEWHRRGRTVLVVDCDPQGTALTWADVAAEGGHVGPVVVACGDAVRATVERLAPSYDVVVIDTPGRLSRRQGGALMVADVVLVPCGASTADVWSATSTIDAVERARELRPELLARLALNRIDARTAQGRAAREALASVPIPTLATSLSSRVAFSEALAVGRGVTEHAGGSSAATELRRLADEVEDLHG